MYLCMLENYPIVASHLNNRQMNRNSTPGFNPTVARQIVWALVAIFVFVIGMAFIRPWYNVWSQEMEGKAEFAKAEQNRKIKIEEARANLEAEKLNAQAEVVRAKGAAEAITPTYIQYLWVRQQSDLSDKTVIYIPTETNLPILESTRMNKIKSQHAPTATHE